MFKKIKKWFSQEQQSARKLEREYFVNGFDNDWPPLPPPTINYNQNHGRTIGEYKHDFSSSAINNELPFLQRIAQLNPNSVTLDFGCGLGRLAAAFTQLGPAVGRYFGYEPESVARKWLVQAYKKDQRFSFGGVDLPKEVNYVTNSKGHDSANKAFELRENAAPEISALARLLGDNVLNLQHTNSVFTHMWPEYAIQTIKRLSHFSDSTTLFVNSWLIVDEKASKAMEDGSADRKLPITTGGILTYSQSNPLVCTAYPLDLIERVYAEAGHVIEDIHFGSWAGRDNGVHYQDIVISKLCSSSRSAHEGQFAA